MKLIDETQLVLDRTIPRYDQYNPIMYDECTKDAYEQPLTECNKRSTQ